MLRNKGAHKLRIGLLAIHRIGEQRPTHHKCRGIRQAEAGFPPMRRETGVLELEQCQVSGYEVAVQRLVWFPLLNRIHTPSCRELYQRWLVWAWTLSLSLGGQSKPAIDGHLKTGQRKEHSGH